MPKLGEHEARIELRVPAEMKEAMEADAKSRDLNLSQFARRLYATWVADGKPPLTDPKR